MKDPMGVLQNKGESERALTDVSPVYLENGDVEFWRY